VLEGASICLAIYQELKEAHHEGQTFFEYLRRQSRTLQHERNSEYPVSPLQFFRSVRVPKFYQAFVDRIRRTNPENEDRRYERPEKAFFSVTEGCFFEAGRLKNRSPRSKNT